MENLLQGLRAAGEITRLRLLVLCGHSELTVSELVQILGQSQPRVSRHLKLLCDAGLLARYQEGSWVYYRLATRGDSAVLARTLVDLVGEEDAFVNRDLDRLEGIKKARIAAADEYFNRNASQWNEIRSLHVSDTQVEEILLTAFGDRHMDDFLDIGTGTGRMLELFADRARQSVGIDSNREMLAYARITIEKAGLKNCQVRLGDMYNLPFNSASQDAVTIHQVLHYADDPAAAINEAARVLRPGGILAIADFNPHLLEYLRDEHAHRRLGFEREEVWSWGRDANLAPQDFKQLTGEPLTVNVWTLTRPVLN